MQGNSYILVSTHAAARRTRLPLARHDDDTQGAGNEELDPRWAQLTRGLHREPAPDVDLPGRELEDDDDAQPD